MSIFMKQSQYPLFSITNRQMDQEIEKKAVVYLMWQQKNFLIRVYKHIDERKNKSK